MPKLPSSFTNRLMVALRITVYHYTSWNINHLAEIFEKLFPNSEAVDESSLEFDGQKSYKCIATLFNRLPLIGFVEIEGS